MKILFLSDNFPPEVNAPATRTFEHCKEWVNILIISNRAFDSAIIVDIK